MKQLHMVPKPVPRQNIEVLTTFEDRNIRNLSTLTKRGLGPDEMRYQSAKTRVNQ